MANANVKYGEPEKFMELVGRANTDGSPTMPKNVVMLLIVYFCKAWRVLMTEEKRVGKPNVWGFPGGGVELAKDSNAFGAVMREFEEETGQPFEQRHWNFSTMRVCNIQAENGSFTRIFMNVCDHPHIGKFKGKPLKPSQEVAFVDFPRLSLVTLAFKDGEGRNPMMLKCGPRELEMRNCVWRMAIPFQKNAEEEKDD
jgi:8-oxo-dGTP pyrophosphatase MutT (NUDIX family)